LGFNDEFSSPAEKTTKTSRAPDGRTGLGRGTFSWTGGTGKYAGIRGAGTYVDYSAEFQPLAEGTIVSYLTFEGNYRTPATPVAETPTSDPEQK
jgi:hypothetical protein